MIVIVALIVAVTVIVVVGVAVGVVVRASFPLADGSHSCLALAFMRGLGQRTCCFRRACY